MHLAWRLFLPIVVIAVWLAPLSGLWMSSPADRAAEAPQSIPWWLLAQSVTVALAAAVLATAIGFVVAFLLRLTQFPAPAASGMLMMIPFLCPPTVWALIQTYAYGPGGLVERFVGDWFRPWVSDLNRGQFLAATLLLAQVHAPLAMILAGRGMRRLPDQGLEAAWFYLAPGPFTVWLVRSLRNELAAAILLAFCLSLGNLAVPMVVQCHLYPVELYLRMSSFLDHASAVHAALPMLGVSLVAAVILGWLLSDSRSTAATRLPFRIQLRGYRLTTVSLVGMYLLLTSGIPVAAVVYECRSVTDFAAATQEALPEMANTFRIALGASLIAGLAALGVAAVIPPGKKSWVAVLAAVPLGIPSLIAGLAYSRFFHRSEPIDWSWVAQGSLLVMLGLAFRGWPFAARVLALERQQYVPRWDEAAAVSRLSPRARWSWIRLPLLMEYLAAALLISFIVAAGDVESAQLLCAPGEGTLALRLFTFLHFGPTHVAASLALLQLILVLLPTTIYLAVYLRHPHVV